MQTLCVTPDRIDTKAGRYVPGCDMQQESLAVEKARAPACRQSGEDGCSQAECMATAVLEAT